jgi:succinate dehydrogenase / fumarate reductase, membrane anchor subunit
MLTDIKKVRSIGGAKNVGVHHWWAQRLTAIALIFLFIWFASTIAGLINNQKPLISLLIAKEKVIIFTILLITMIYHSTLGVQVIIEDYIHNEKVKFSLLIFIKLFAILTSIFLISAIISLIFLQGTANV